MEDETYLSYYKLYSISTQETKLPNTSFLASEDKKKDKRNIRKYFPFIGEAGISHRIKKVVYQL